MMLYINQRVQAGSVTISRWIFYLTLIVLSMYDFDTILKMDLLEENPAFIDCNARLMIFRPLIGESFIYKGVSPKNTLRITSTLSYKVD